jgi:hypothetical protein
MCSTDAKSHNVSDLLWDKDNAHAGVSLPPLIEELPELLYLDMAPDVARKVGKELY